MLEGTTGDTGYGEANGEPWRRSSLCSAHGCVEVAVTGTRVLVRDSKDPNAAMLTYTHDEWLAFVAGVKKGEFDFRY